MTIEIFQIAVTKHGLDNLELIIIDNARRIYFDYNDYENNKIIINITKGCIEEKKKIADRDMVIFTDFNEIQGLVFRDVNPNSELTKDVGSTYL